MEGPMFEGDSPQICVQPPPSPRDEPLAASVYWALRRVRNAGGWADVARQVASTLEAQGVAGDEAVTMLRQAERDRDQAIVGRSQARLELRRLQKEREG